MKMKTNPKDVYDAIVGLPTNKNFSLSHLQKILTEEDIKDLAFHVTENIPLISFRTGHSISDKACSILFKLALPFLFDESDIKKYFLNLLLLKYNDEEIWERPNKRSFFFEITGYTIDNCHKRNMYIGIVFSDVYDKMFVKDYFYPDTFKTRTIEAIDNRSSLAENYKEFKSKYVVGDDSYLVYLNVHIIKRIGKDSFKNYLIDMVDHYINFVGEVNIDNITNDRILDYIFGYHWVISLQIGAYTSGTRAKKPKHYELHVILLEVLFPKTIRNYNSKRNRLSVYKLLNLTETEIHHYEDVYSNIDKHSRVITLNDESDNITLPSGKSLDYLYQFIDEYFINIQQNDRTVDFKNTVYDNLRLIVQDDELLSDLNYFRKRPKKRIILFRYIENKINETKAFFFSQNDKEITEKKDIYIIYYNNKGKYAYRSHDLTPLESPALKNEIRLYLRNAYKANRRLEVRSASIVTALAYFEEKYRIKTSQDITENHIFELLHHLEVNSGFKPLTINKTLYTLKAYFDFLLGLKDYPYTLLLNPALNIKLENVLEHVKHTPVIPDDILVFLESNISQLKQKHYELIYRILIETGWRFGDIKQLNINSFEPLNEELATITTASSKTRESRIKNLLGNTISDVISIHLYHDIKNYIAQTQHIREKYDTNLVFFSIENNSVIPVSIYSFNKALNELCRKNNITSVDTSFVSISSRQTRKTVASTLISNGAPTSAVQKKLGHVTDATTKRYYSEVQHKKIGELNTEFYKQKFAIYMDDEKLKYFTEEERKVLYIDFCLNKRDVELGVCSKHPSEGSCITLGQTSCAKCPKIITGEKYLPQWVKLANDSKSLLEQFEAEYISHGIAKNEYENFIEYKQEHSLYLHYKEVIEAIKRGR